MLDLQELAKVESTGKLTCAAAIFAATFSRLASKVILWLRGCSVPSDALKELLKLLRHEGEWPRCVFKEMSVFLTLDGRGSNGATVLSLSLRLFKNPTNARVSIPHTLPTYLDSRCHPPHHTLKTYYVTVYTDLQTYFQTTSGAGRVDQADMSISTVCPISWASMSCMFTADSLTSLLRKSQRGHSLHGIAISLVGDVLALKVPWNGNSMC